MCNKNIIKLKDNTILKFNFQKTNNPEVQNPKSNKIETSETDQQNTTNNHNEKDWSKEVPLMFQAQVEGRCQIQREGNNQNGQIYDWTDQWTKYYPQETSKPKPKLIQKPKLQQSRNNPAIQGFTPPKENPVTQKFEIKPPQFKKNSTTHDYQDYKIDWRLVTNSGQDDFIRPVIGINGYPYYPGSSMKGAFRRACDNKNKNYDNNTKTQAEYYCGKDADKNNNSQPGILRFHGGYPINNKWTEKLVDLVHSQQSKQVIQDQSTNPVKQIALHNTTILRFGISSNEKLDQDQWKEIWEIWEKALGYGLGSRVSAGYGRFQKQLEDDTWQLINLQQEELLSFDIKGQGIASILNKTPEFRPNMFKAVLRGHTLRLLGGITDKKAEELTNFLWGGIDNGATLGSLGVTFEYDKDNLEIIKFNHYMNTFKLEKGTLKVFLMNQNLLNKEQKNLPKEEQEKLIEAIKKELKELATSLIQFAMLFGGFGKSWRRVDHQLFYPSYLAKGDKPMIGCHWQFIDDNNFLDLSDNGNNFNEKLEGFIDKIREKLINFAKSNFAKSKIQNFTENITTANDWREAWYKNHVKVYGRIAEDQNDSKAVYWFHQAYKVYNNSTEDTIYEKDFAGFAAKKVKEGEESSKTGRLWHRMYPLEKGKYLELLTVFPDNSDPISRKFIKFLDNKSQSDFEKIW